MTAGRGVVLRSAALEKRPGVIGSASVQEAIECNRMTFTPLLPRSAAEGRSRHTERELMGHLRKKGGVVAAIAAMVAMLGIASQTNAFDLAGESDAPVVQAVSSPKVRMPLSGSRQPACTRARVRLGAGRTAIRFVVWCAPEKGGQIARFAVDRYSLENIHAKSDIRSVTQPPQLRGEGGCILLEGVVSCSVRAKRPVEVSGTINVPRGRRCTMKVAISVVRPPKCRSGLCEAVLDLDYLANRLPRGC